MVLSRILHERWLKIVLALLIVAAGAAYLAAPALLGSSARAFQVGRSDLLQTVVASGRVETPARVDIGVQVTGRVLAVPVKEGQNVKAGDLLFELESSDERAAVALAEAAVQQAEVKLKQMRELSAPLAEQNLVQAQANLANVEKQYARTRDLVAQGFVGKAQLDDAQRNLDVAHSQLKTAQFQLKSARPAGSDFQVAQTALQQAQANLAQAQAKLGHTRVYAVADGTLISRDIERGDTVQPGKILMVLSPVGVTQLVVQIDEKNLRFIHLGQAAQAVTDAYPGQKFPAQVAYINPGIDAQRGSVNVKLNVLKVPPFLSQDMTVSVEIEVGRSKNALSLNVEAVHDLTTLQPWVTVIADGKARKRSVGIGIRGDQSVEITSGLQAGDWVLSATGLTVSEGQRVRPQLSRTPS